MSKEFPTALDMKHDEHQVRELRLAADLINEQVQATTAVSALLNSAAERIEWLSQCVSLNERAKREAEPQR